MSCYVLYLYTQWSLFLSLSISPIKHCWLLARSLQTQRAWTTLWWCGSPPGNPPLLSKSTWWNGGSSIRGVARSPLWTGYGLPPATCPLWFQVLNCSPAFRRVTKFTFVWGNCRWEPQTLPFNYEWLHENAGEWWPRVLQDSTPEYTMAAMEGQPTGRLRAPVSMENPHAWHGAI